MRWQDKLNKANLAHLRDVAGNTTLAQIKRTCATQAEIRLESDNDPILEPCWECKQIARKLGLPV